MAQLLVTCVHRHHNVPSVSGGTLFRVDTDTGEARIANGSLAGVGGLRGVTVDPVMGLVYVADNAHSIYVLDRFTWITRRVIQVPGAAGIHQIRWHAGRLYVVSTGSDCLLVGTPTQHNGWTWEETKLWETIPDHVWRRLVTAYGKDHAHHAPGADRLHFNSIAWAPNGDEIHLYCAPCVVYNATQHRVMCHERLHGPHDLLYMGDRLFVHSSKAGSLLECGGKAPVLVDQHDIGGTNKNNLQGFTRGLAALDAKTFVAGVTPGLLRVYALSHGVVPWKVRDIELLGGDELSVYDIAVLA